MLVSVVIPTFNRSNFIQRAIDSALNQSYNNIEILVVDDGSTDDTEIVVKNISTKENRVRYYRKINGGPNSARNFGIDKANGELIAFLDSDDYWLPNKINLQVELLIQNPHIDIVFTDYLLKTKNAIEAPKYIPSFPPRSLHKQLVLGNVITGSASSILIRRSCFHVCGSFDETLRAYEDLDMWRRLSVRFQFGKVQAPCVVIEIHPMQAQGNSTFMFTEGFKYLDKLKYEEKKYPNLVRKFARRLFTEYLHQPINGEHSWNTAFRNYRALWETRPDSHFHLIQFSIYYVSISIFNNLKIKIYRMLMKIGIGYVYVYLKSKWKNRNNAAK